MVLGCDAYLETGPIMPAIVSAMAPDCTPMIISSAYEVPTRDIRHS